MQHQIGGCQETLVLKRVFLVVLSIWFAWVSNVGKPVYAQSFSTDSESPEIEHEPIDDPVNWGEVQVFKATVVDNDEIKQVRLFYRFSGDQAFTEVRMQRRAASSSFTARVDTSQYGKRKDAIEYYITAEDVSDNRVQRGYAFGPLMRTFVSTVPAAPIASTTPVTDPPSASDSRVEHKGFNWLYVALGVVALGGIAALIDDDPEDRADDCEPTCTVTLSIETP